MKKKQTQINGQMCFFGSENVWTPPVKKELPKSKENDNVSLDIKDFKETGKMISNDELQKLFALGIKQVKDAGIEIGDLDPVCRINHRATSFWGKCHHRRGKHWIEVTENLLQTSIKDIMTTICHEILHTCVGCQNHGVIWKRYAAKMNDKYGYNIKRCTSSEEKGLSVTIDSYRYILQCTGCEQKIGRNKMSNLVRSPEHFLCVKCRQKFKRIK